MTLNPSIAEQELLTLAESELALLTALTTLADLRRQQGELRGLLDTSTARVDLNDPKALDKIGQNRTRLELIPQRLQESERVITEATENLREAILVFRLVFDREAQNVRESARKVMETALREIGIADYRIESLMPELLNSSETIKEADGLSNFVSALGVNSTRTAQGLLTTALRVRQIFDLHVVKS